MLSLLDVLACTLLQIKCSNDLEICGFTWKPYKMHFLTYSILQGMTIMLNIFHMV